MYDFEDLGLIGLALAPSFPADPWVYVSYRYDGVIGGTPPTYHDTCSTIGSCRASSRVSRLRANGNVMTGSEQVLLHDWCQQVESHSIGDLHFGPDGALYVSGGEGASGTFTDYGQAGNPSNPCGDPPAPIGGTMTPPNRRGWGAAGAGRTHPGGSDETVRHADPGRPRHGRRIAGQPDGRERGRQRAADRGVRAARPIPVDVPARHQRNLGR